MAEDAMQFANGGLTSKPGGLPGRLDCSPSERMRRDPRRDRLADVGSGIFLNEM
jgi:hypothetical protein